MLTPDLPQDLSSCDLEPINTPGTIQPHGVLLTLRPSDLRIEGTSANAAKVFSKPAAQLLGLNLQPLLGVEATTQLRRHIKRGLLNVQQPATLEISRAPGAGGRYDAGTSSRTARATYSCSKWSVPRQEVVGCVTIADCG